MIYKNISAKYVIAKLYRDLALSDSNYELSFIEWIGEALDFIGSASQLVTVEDTLVVESFKAPLPQGFVLLNQLKYDDPDQGRIYLKYNPSSFNPIDDGSPNYRTKTQESFSLNPNFIVTSFEEGVIDISYKSIALDEDGYPLVPDNQYFREALFWYCFKKMLMSGYQPKLRDLTYEFAEINWQRYCTAARNKANFPDISNYQRFADVWVGLVPNKRTFEEGFDRMQRKGIELETVRADNVITRPLTVEKPLDDSPNFEQNENNY